MIEIVLRKSLRNQTVPDDGDVEEILIIDTYAGISCCLGVCAEPSVVTSFTRRSDTSPERARLWRRFAFVENANLGAQATTFLLHEKKTRGRDTYYSRDRCTAATRSK